MWGHPHHVHEPAGAAAESTLMLLPGVRVGRLSPRDAINEALYEFNVQFRDQGPLLGRGLVIRAQPAWMPWARLRPRGAAPGVTSKPILGRWRASVTRGGAAGSGRLDHLSTAALPFPYTPQCPRGKGSHPGLFFLGIATAIISNTLGTRVTIQAATGSHNTGCICGQRTV